MGDSVELRLDEPLARLLVEHCPDGIYALDPQGKCVWSNAAAARIFGYASPAAYVGKQMHGVIHHTRADGSPYPEEECTGLQRLRAGEVIVQPQELLWRADGSSFYAEVHVNPIAPQGKVTGAVVVLRDLTERLRMEEQIRQALKMEAVGRLAAGIAHDFNNLLTVIKGFAELLQQEPGLGEAAARRLAGIERAGSRAAELTRQLLAFSRAQEMHPGILDLNRFLEEAAGRLRAELGTGLELEMDLDAELAPIEGDAGSLEEVLVNLARNAREAMAGGGRLRLETRRTLLQGAAARRLGLHDGEYARLSFADNGRGMDDATRQRIFEPFFTTKQVGEGSGLGLAMVLGVVEQSGGAVRVESAAGRGAEFQIYLPARSSGAPAPPLPTAGREIILLVAEEAGARAQMLEHLAALGYTLAAAASAARGLQLARQYGQELDLLILGAVVGGAALVSDLRRRHPGLPVLYLSGVAAADAAAEDAQTAVLPPRFTLAAMARQARRLLDGAGAEAAAAESSVSVR